MRKIFFLLLVLSLFSPLVVAEEQEKSVKLEDYGEKPWAVDIEDLTLENNNYRAVKWSGRFMQMALMSLKPGEEIELEMHSASDQFIRIEEGEGLVYMGESKDNLSFVEYVKDDWAVFIPAGIWHKLLNTGKGDLKFYTIYAPQEHSKATVHKTFADARAAHHEHHE